MAANLFTGQARPRRRAFAVHADAARRGFGARLVLGQDNSASRTHISLEGNAPWPRAREPTPASEVIATQVLGGLHHTYRRAA